MKIPIVPGKHLINFRAKSRDSDPPEVADSTGYGMPIRHWTLLIRAHFASSPKLAYGCSICMETPQTLLLWCGSCLLCLFSPCMISWEEQGLVHKNQGKQSLPSVRLPKCPFWGVRIRQASSFLFLLFCMPELWFWYFCQAPEGDKNTKTFCYDVK